MTAPLTETSVIARTDDLMSAAVGDEVVMLHLERNAYYDLDAIGAAIWEQLESPRKVADVVDWLMDRYQVDRETCSRDVLAFITEALAEGVVRVVESA